MLRSLATRCRAYTCLFVPLRQQVCRQVDSRTLHVSAFTLNRHRLHAKGIKNFGAIGEAVHHEDEFQVEEIGEQGEQSKIRDEYFEFATENTHSVLYNGVPFIKLPTVYIRATSNNTILTLTRGENGSIMVTQSGGTVGFKNARKGTNVAAQVAAVALAQAALDRGIKTVRVVVKGIGPGRVVSVKSLADTGLEVVSITDNTQIGQKMRTKKQRRI